MKTRIYTTLLLIMAMTSTALSLTSCDGDDDYYYNGGPLTYYNWQLYSVNGFAVSELDVVEFQFFDGGSGTYGRYSPAGSWYTVNITWSTDYAGPTQYLNVFIPSSGQSWDYAMSISGGPNPTLYLTDLQTGDRLTFYNY